MKRAIFAMSALALAACSAPVTETALEPDLYVVGYGVGVIDGITFDREVVMSIGPLPYGMAECEERIAERQLELDTAEDVVIGFHVELACEEHVERPELQDAVPLY